MMCCRRVLANVFRIALLFQVVIPAAFAQIITVGPTIPVGTNPQRAAITPNGAEVYVSNTNDNTVSVISTASKTVTDVVPVGSEPRSLAVSPGGSKVYVGNVGGDISVIDTSTKTISTISTGVPAFDIALTPDGSKLYIAAQDSGLVRVLTATNTVATIDETACPEGVAVTPDGTTLYVNYQCFGPGGGSGHDAVGIFDVATDSFVSSITGLPNVGGPIAVSPNGTQVWENGSDACSNSVYDHKGCPVVPGVPEDVVNVISVSSNSLLQSIGFSLADSAGVISFLRNSTDSWLVATR